MIDHTCDLGNIDLIKITGTDQETPFNAAYMYNELYDITKDRKLESLTFDNAETVLSKYIKKNKDDFIKLLNKQNRLRKKLRTPRKKKIKPTL